MLGFSHDLSCLSCLLEVVHLLRLDWKPSPQLPRVIESKSVAHLCKAPQFFLTCSRTEVELNRKMEKEKVDVSIHSYLHVRDYMERDMAIEEPDYGVGVELERRIRSRTNYLYPT